MSRTLSDTPRQNCDVCRKPSAQRTLRDTRPWICDVCRGECGVPRIAKRQRGLITRPQLLALGFTRWAIARRVAKGLLHEIYPGVYLVGHTVAPPLACELGATLACGPDSFLSHFSAAQLWGLLEVQRRTVDVTVVGRTCRARPGVTIHRSRQIQRSDLTRRAGILVARPGRVLLDLAETASEGQLARAWDEAHSRELINPDQMQKLIRRSPGRHGIPRLRQLLERDATGISKSQAEARLSELIRRARLPYPEKNILLGQYEFDFVWRDRRYILELDGGHHDRPSRRDYDNRRDSELRDNDWRVDHVSRYEVIYEPEAVIARLARALTARPPRPRPPAGTSAG